MWTPPWTEENVKRVIRKSYDALSISIVQSSRVSDKVVEEIGKKCKEEVKHICSSKHNSVLKDTGEAVNHFSWDTIWMEFSRNIPYLMKLIQWLLNKKHKNNKALIWFLLSLIVKSHSLKRWLFYREQYQWQRSGKEGIYSHTKWAIYCPLIFFRCIHVCHTQQLYG